MVPSLISQFCVSPIQPYMHANASTDRRESVGEEEIQSMLAICHGGHVCVRARVYVVAGLCLYKQ